MWNAPAFTDDFRKTPERLPRRFDVREIPDSARPFWLPLFDSQSLLGGPMAGNDTQESTYKFGSDFWWCATTASTISGDVDGFAVQMFRMQKDANGDQQTSLYQKTPLFWQQIAGQFLGVEGILPFYLKRPRFWPAGTAIQCRVQNLSPNNNKIQFVLFGYLQGARR